MNLATASSSTMDNSVEKSRWSARGYLLLLLLLTGLLYRNELWTLFASWFDDGDYITKGPLLWGLAFYYLFRDISAQRVFLRQISLGDILLLVVVLIALVWLRDRLPLLLPMLVIAFLRHLTVSPNTNPNIFVIFCLLAFSLPYFPLLVPWLQFMAVYVVESILSLFGIPAIVQEYYIAIPRGQFFVAGACSGFRYLANNLILFFLFALFSRFNTRQFLMALGITVLLSLAVNWLRIFIIVFVAHNWGLEVPFFVRGHGNLGWVVYAFMLVPFFWSFLRIERMRLAPPKGLQFLQREWLPVSSQWLLLPVFAWSLIR